MTSNLGSDLIKRETTLGFTVKSGDAQTTAASYDRMKEKVMDEVKRFFRPEFLNRIDATVVFHQLDETEILAIVDLMMDQVKKELDEKKIGLEMTEEAKKHLAEKGFDPVFGARPLRRLIQNEVEDSLSDEVLGGNLNDGDVALVDLEDDKIVIRNKGKAAEDSTGDDDGASADDEAPVEAGSPA
jgi:ATP-dependent Clp protease ATP-binding subunit ClpC